MTTEVRRVDADTLLSYADGIRGIYLDAFGSPPWDESAERAAAYLKRLASDVERPGFAAALALNGARLLGFAVGWTTPTPFPSGRCYPQVAAALGPLRTEEWLCGGMEVDELAVGTAARGRGVGTALLEAVTTAAADGRCWLLTSVRADSALRFYRRLGWRQATHPAPAGRGVAAFLGPGHPAELPF
ncbi:Acetyltransferase (GNAT) family protein [Streptomyces sp. WMMB 714]|uniref:GNAT family N-acetyltransferase n=1 Tax=Streptomyces sp. WMMB 714 TaxID=1286822 RepID=UPI0005F80446|nr:GNAT family N-acetyltransferase [Streptomyces sp. WMMB 714]SCK25679.1 Acetyltransferase (GNAT) family protein [Streptomyces sp. WMMB 714]